MDVKPVSTAMCEMCGQPIVFIGPHWSHVGPLQPKHPAIPAKEPLGVLAVNEIYARHGLTDVPYISSRIAGALLRLEKKQFALLRLALAAWPVLDAIAFEYTPVQEDEERALLDAFLLAFENDEANRDVIREELTDPFRIVHLPAHLRRPLWNKLRERILEDLARYGDKADGDD